MTPRITLTAGMQGDAEHLGYLLQQATDEQLETVWVALVEARGRLEEQTMNSPPWVILYVMKDIVSDEIEYRRATMEAAEAEMNGGHLTSVWEDEGHGFSVWCWCGGLKDVPLLPTRDEAKAAALAHWPTEPEDRDAEGSLT